jgi:hypothetical protein
MEDRRGGPVRGRSRPRIPRPTSTDFSFLLSAFVLVPLSCGQQLCGLRSFFAYFVAHPVFCLSRTVATPADVHREPLVDAPGTP